MVMKQKEIKSKHMTNDVMIYNYNKMGGNKVKHI